MAGIGCPHALSQKRQLVGLLLTPQLANLAPEARSILVRGVISHVIGWQHVRRGNGKPLGLDESGPTGQ